MFNASYTYMCWRMLYSRAFNAVGVEAFRFGCLPSERC